MERRQHNRASIDYELEVSLESGNNFYAGIMRDISEGGLFIVTDRIHRDGEIMKIAFKFPGIEGPIEVTCMVQWRRCLFSGSPMDEGIGVKFMDLDPEISKKINAYLKDNDSNLYEEGY